MMAKQLKRKRGVDVSPADLRRTATSESSAPSTLRRFMQESNLVLVSVGGGKVKFATRPELPTIVEGATSGGGL